MARTPFKLKSGNNIKSAFKMMGSSSPAKLREVYVDDVLVEGENYGKGEGAVEKGIDVEKANTRKRNYNRAQKQDEYYSLYDQQEELAKQGVKTPEQKAAFDALSEQMSNIEKGNFEGGRKTQTVTYTDEEKRLRDLKAQGLKTGTVEGAFPSEEGKIRLGEDVKTFDTDEEYKQWLRTQKVNQ